MRVYQFLLLLLLLPVFSTMAKTNEQNVIERPASNWGTVTFEELKREPLWGTMKDEESLDILDPNNFDITVEIENSFLYDNPGLHVEGNRIVLDIHPKGEWCECLFPKTLKINICSTQKAGAYDAEGKNYAKLVQPIYVTVVKNRAWFPRCFWVIASIIGLLLLFFYLRALSKKCRFKKNASVSPFYLSRYGAEIDDGGSQLLRKNEFSAWLARWFWPGAEQNTLTFNQPNVRSITFIASESSEVVYIPKSDFDPELMKIDEYDPQTETDQKKPIRLANNGNIIIYKSRGIKEGRLCFTANNERDGGGFRLFLIVLMIASLVVVAGLIYLGIRSFF
jgi:hypothetical protein